ncbi:hypothetical protein PUNSTDRAFT_97994 [Punctularia strigosozonata HHB-11173 SS5]|uniref:uncharacterized protein n=1 Tax=Punctularia strigosozonata (strain HHB-11173) TaxID=741275 RepID=UPI000441831E|nr:uncharacterized protein PUNSTDRAFT_97994 [Punctularia strigosozonata HHB-11173 SS5]EIN12989.1 hypothetical protein PUNSTDRAFT_97994 [Punctularia strigosozonata HHB-11173 SS5]
MESRTNGLAVHRPTHSAQVGGSYPSMGSSMTLVNGNTQDGLNRAVHEETELDKLVERLGIEMRIMEGAENMLQTGRYELLKGNMRGAVEAEYDESRKRVAEIKAKIDKLTRPAARGKPESGSHQQQGPTQPTQSRPKEENTKEREDFRTALNQTKSWLKVLTTWDRQPQSPTAFAASSSSRQAPVKTEDPQTDGTRISYMNKLTAILQRNLRVRYELDIAEVVRAITPCLADSASKECRSCAYRLVRHALVDRGSIERLQDRPLDWYIVKSLARDGKHAVEKEQVVKLIRTIVEIGSDRDVGHSGSGKGNVPLSDSVMRAFIAVAEQPEDPFRPICLETLLEILLIDIDLMARTGGLLLLLHAMAEGPPDISPLLASAFLNIVNSPRTRKYLFPGTDLEIALQGITDAYGKGPDYSEQMRRHSKVVAMMFRTWSGLMYFCMNNMLAIRAIVNTLRIPSLETREIVLDMFFDLLDIKAHGWTQQFIDGRRLTIYRRQHKNDSEATDSAEREPEALKLTDQYIALFVLVFTKAGLLDALTSMLEETPAGSNLTRKATLLMAEVLQLANRLLPLSMAAEIQSVPRVFNLASDYHLNEHRIIGTSTLNAIDSFNRNTSRIQPTAVKNTTRPRANSVEDAVRRGQRSVEQSKIKSGMQIDDRTFSQALLETGVTLTKDYTKWNFDVLQDLIEGAFLNPKRLEEAIKVSKYMRRLMSFFHPFSHRFSDIPRKDNRWVKLGCSLLTTLMASPDGQRFLSTEDPFLRDIVKAFAQLDPFNGTPEIDPIFSKTRVQTTLTYGYFEMLGTLSKQKEGIELLEKFKVFTAFYHLLDLRSREDLIKGIIDNLDYSFDGHSRIVLSKALTSSYKPIRLYATEHLGELIRKSKPNTWTLRLLLTQLYDPAMEVCDMAVRFLDEACEDLECLRLVVDMQPNLDHLGELGHPLLLKFMSTPVGFRYLHDAGYIDREMDIWFHERNLHYAVQVEVILAKFFKLCPSEEDEDLLAFDGFSPPHFYGEMVKTDLGCQVLQEKGHFNDFVDFIRQQASENADPDVILKLKSTLWAVGHIGATEGGLPFLEETDIIPVILEIAEQSLTLSVRGTCFYVLGLISSTPLGAEILTDYQWEATLSPLGIPTGICVPMDVRKFASIPPWAPAEVPKETRLAPPATEAEQEVIAAIHNLANAVVANAASRTLAKMKARPEHRHIFSSPTMIYRAFHILSTQHYRLPVRRYIMDLFEFKLDADMVKSLQEAAESVRLQPSPKDANGKTSQRVMSIFGRPRPAHRVEESDEEDESDEENKTANVIRDRPVMSLRPVSRIVGFDH